MENLQIRAAGQDDAVMLSELSYRTFRDAFHGHPLNSPDDMAAYMNSAFSAEQIGAEIADANSLFLIAFADGDPAGYAKLLFGNLEEPVTGEIPVELCRLYSETRFIGHGIGQALMDECFRIARERACDVMWLGVWEHNPRAQRFYEKQGFRIVGDHVFQLGSDPQTDHLMAVDL